MQIEAKSKSSVQGRDSETGLSNVCALPPTLTNGHFHFLHRASLIGQVSRIGTQNGQVL